MAGQPLIVIAADDESTRSRLGADLSRRFGADYRLLCVGFDEAPGLLDGLANREERVAAVIAEPRSNAGVEFLAGVRIRHPGTRRILLVGRGGWHHHPVRQAMVLGQVDGYLFMPWFPLEQWLYLPMSEYLADYDRTRTPEQVAFTVIGDRWDSRCHQLRDILSRASIPFRFLPADSRQGQAGLREAGQDGSELPVLRIHTGTVLVNPTDLELIEELGFPSDAEGVDCDVAIIGAGPSGMSAAVYAASEGLRTTVVDPSVPGGQAGTSSMIRNYLGFPRGVSGAELTNRALEQALAVRSRVLPCSAGREPGRGRQRPTRHLGLGVDDHSRGPWSSRPVSRGAVWVCRPSRGWLEPVCSMAPPDPRPRRSPDLRSASSGAAIRLVRPPSTWRNGPPGSRSWSVARR